MVGLSKRSGHVRELEVEHVPPTGDLLEVLRHLGAARATRLRAETFDLVDKQPNITRDLGHAAQPTKRCSPTTTLLTGRRRRRSRKSSKRRFDHRAKRSQRSSIALEPPVPHASRSQFQDQPLTLRPGKPGNIQAGEQQGVLAQPPLIPLPSQHPDKGRRCGPEARRAPTHPLLEIPRLPTRSL